MKFVTIVFTYTTQQAFWLTKFFDEVRLPTITPVMIYVDNNYFISYSLNNKNYQYTKHINVKYYFIKQRTKLSHVTFDYILSTNNIAAHTLTIATHLVHCLDPYCKTSF